jgi:hypothetical protein
MALRIRSGSLVVTLLGLLAASVARAEEPLPTWENDKKPTAPAPAAPAPAAPAPAKPTAPAPAAKPAAPKALKPVAKPAATTAPKPAPAAATAKGDAPAGFEQRWRELEASLYRAGVLAPPAANDEKKQAIEAELAKLEAQQKSLDAAIKGGLDPETVKPVLANIQVRTAALKQELATLPAAQVAVPAGPKPPLVARLDALETQVKALEARANAATPPANESATQAAPAEKMTDAKDKKETALTAGYDDGFVLRSADGNYKLQPLGFLQVRFSHEWLEKAPDRTAFSLPRARVGLKGNVVNKDVKYYFLVDYGKGRFELSYFYLDYTVAKDVLAVRAGVQKRPFSRMFLTSSEKLELVSSSSLNKAFGDAHDLGVELHNGTPAFEYAVGIFNGNGSKGVFTGDVTVDPTTGKGKVTSGDFNSVPDRFHPAFVARAAYNHGDIQGYSEADLEGGPARFSVGIAGIEDADFDNDNVSYLRGTVDAVVKAYGFNAQAGGFISSKQVGKAFGERAYEASGLLLESGYTIAQRFQPVVRYAWLTPAEPVYDTHELAAGFNVYMKKHALKLQNELNARFTRPKAGPRKDFGYLMQAQVMF